MNIVKIDKHFRGHFPSGTVDKNQPANERAGQ